MTQEVKLKSVFGPGLGETPELRARQSNRMFVRGLDQLAEDSPRATGRRLTAWEALEAYGFETLQEVVAEGSVLLSPAIEAPGKVLHERRVSLGLTAPGVARATRMTVQELESCEASKRVPLRTYERVAQALGLDERFIGVKSHAVGNDMVAVRLRNVGIEGVPLGPSTVAALAEAAWVGMTQGRLQALLGLAVDRHHIKTNNNYGTSDFPAYRWGYRLAHEVRKALGLSDEPVESMRKVVEEFFRIPLIQTELGDSVAGATLETEGHRCIVVNISGDNHNVTTRRATIAHELGHLIFDPPNELASLRVDTYEELEREREHVPDRVEQRANAFAVELLAPQTAILKTYRTATDDPLFETMVRFGVGRTAARYQIFNGSNRSIPLSSINTRARPTQPREMTDWEGVEAFAVNSDFHPLPGVRSSRQGRFCAVVLRAAVDRLISWDTAASHLGVTEKDARDALKTVREFFPAVWEDSNSSVSAESANTRLAEKDSE